MGDGQGHFGLRFEEIAESRPRTFQDFAAGFAAGQAHGVVFERVANDVRPVINGASGAGPVAWQWRTRIKRRRLTVAGVPISSRAIRKLPNRPMGRSSRLGH